MRDILAWLRWQIAPSRLGPRELPAAVTVYTTAQRARRQRHSGELVFLCEVVPDASMFESCGSGGNTPDAKGSPSRLARRGRSRCVHGLSSGSGSSRRCARCVMDRPRCDRGHRCVHAPGRSCPRRRLGRRWRHPQNLRLRTAAHLEPGDMNASLLAVRQPSPTGDVLNRESRLAFPGTCSARHTVSARCLAPRTTTPTTRGSNRHAHGHDE